MSAADDGRSLGELVASATAELSALLHDEIALAKAEIRQDTRRVAFGGVAGVIAGVLGVFAIPMFSFALALWLRNWWDIPLAVACAIVGGLYLLLAMVLILLARSRFSRVEPPRRSIASARRSASVLSRVRPRPRSVPADRADTAA